MLDFNFFITVTLLTPIIINIFILFVLSFGFVVKGKVLLSSDKVKKITILLPTYNDRHGVIDALDSIEMQVCTHNINVIVIDDGSNDGSGIIIDDWLAKNNRKYSYSVVHLDVNSGMKGKAIKYGLDKISLQCDTIAIMDGDTVLDPCAVQNCIGKLYSDDRFAAVCGMILPKSNGVHNIVSRLQACELIGAFHAMRLAQSNIDSASCLSGAFTMFRFDAVQEVGWFDEWLVEDICWTWKAKAQGWRLGFSEKSYVFTECPDSIEKLWKQRRRWSRGRMEAFKVALSIDRKAALYVSPWLIYSITQILSLPLLIIAAFFSPIFSIFLLSIFFMIHLVYARVNIRGIGELSGGISAIESALWSSIFIDLFLLVPNVRGMMDEVLGRDKSWLTR